MMNNIIKSSKQFNILLIVLFVFSFLSFHPSKGEDQISKDLIHYFENWGNQRYRKTNSITFSQKLDSIAIVDISLILKSPTKRMMNKIISRLHSEVRSFEKKTPSNKDLIIRQHHENKTLIFEKLSYPTIKLSTEDKLLAICQYWNIIRFFHPHFRSFAENWNNKLPAFIKKIISSESLLDYNLLLCEMAALTKDGHGDIHSSIVQNYWGYFYIPIKLNIINQTPVVTGLYHSMITGREIKLGDQIISINGISFSEFMLKNKHLITANTEQIKLDKGSLLFLRKKKEKPVSIKIKRKDTIIHLEIKPIHKYNIDWSIEKSIYTGDPIRKLSDSIAYLNIGRVEKSDLNKTAQLLIDFPQIIIDFREYPNVSRDELSLLFFDKRRTITGWRYPDLSNPGTFIIGPPIKLGTFNSNVYKGTIAILVNSNTWSQGEFTALSLQALSNCVTIGSQTSGTDGDVSKFNLAGGIQVKFSGLDITYPDGTPTYPMGLKIDYIYNSSPDNWQEGHDPELQFAIQILDSLALKQN